MPTQLTTDDFKKSLSDHLATKGQELRLKYGPHIGWKELLRVLEDRAFCRYPCEIVFTSAGLQPGEFAYPVARTERPEDGFTMQVHPLLLTRLEEVPYLVLYLLVVVNYGDFASPDDAETFGASALGLSRDDYYTALCSLSDQLSAG